MIGRRSGDGTSLSVGGVRIKRIFYIYALRGCQSIMHQLNDGRGEREFSRTRSEYQDQKL